MWTVKFWFNEIFCFTNIFQDLYEKFGRSAPDGGDRMYEQIQMLKGQLAQLKNQSKLKVNLNYNHSIQSRN